MGRFIFLGMLVLGAQIGHAQYAHLPKSKASEGLKQIHGQMEASTEIKEKILRAENEDMEKTQEFKELLQLQEETLTLIKKRMGRSPRVKKNLQSMIKNYPRRFFMASSSTAYSNLFKIRRAFLDKKVPHRELELFLLDIQMQKDDLENEKTELSDLLNSAVEVAAKFDLSCNRELSRNEAELLELQSNNRWTYERGYLERQRKKLAEIKAQLNPTPEKEKEWKEKSFRLLNRQDELLKIIREKYHKSDAFLKPAKEFLDLFNFSIKQIEWTGNPLATWIEDEETGEKVKLDEYFNKHKLKFEYSEGFSFKVKKAIEDSIARLSAKLKEAGTDKKKIKKTLEKLRKILDSRNIDGVIPDMVSENRIPVLGNHSDALFTLGEYERCLKGSCDEKAAKQLIEAIEYSRLEGSRLTMIKVWDLSLRYGNDEEVILKELEKRFDTPDSGYFSTLTFRPLTGVGAIVLGLKHDPKNKEKLKALVRISMNARNELVSTEMDELIKVKKELEVAGEWRNYSFQKSWVAEQEEKFYRDFGHLERRYMRLMAERQICHGRIREVHEGVSELSTISNVNRKSVQNIIGLIRKKQRQPSLSVEELNVRRME